MHTITARATLDQIAARVRDIFTANRTAKEPHKQLCCALQQQLWEPLAARYPSGKAKFSSYILGFAAGVVASERERIWAEYVEFCYMDQDGTLYSTHRDSTHQTTQVWYDQGKGSELGALVGRHYWKGTDKPF